MDSPWPSPGVVGVAMILARVLPPRHYPYYSTRPVDILFVGGVSRAVKVPFGLNCACARELNSAI